MSETWIRLIVLACIFGAAMIAIQAAIGSVLGKRSTGQAISRRLKTIGRADIADEAPRPLRRRMDLALNVPPRLAPMALKFERMLVAAQIKAPARLVLALAVAVPAALFLVTIVLVLAADGSLGVGRLVMIATFALIAGGMLPLMLVQMKAARTRKMMQEQFPVALDVFVRSLRAGHPIAAALNLLTVEMPDPIGAEFRMVADELTYGGELRDALQAMAERWDLEEMHMFVVSLSVQSETGGNLAEILENLVKVIRDRASMMMKVRALSSEGRMTGTMLTVLPVFAFVLLFLLNPQFYLEVADDRAFVIGFTGLGLLYAIGFFTIRRLVDLKI
jgi:tight adherence protein B